MTRAFVFPGQGAQAVGMGRALAEAYPAARAVFAEVDAALGAQVAAEDTVFVFVRGEAGGPPLAALRFKGSELPLDFSFNGATLMMGDAQVPERVVVAARVAKGGDATARAGDLEGATQPVAADASGLKLVIDRVRN